MDTKEQILDLYYNKHLKQNEIAKLVGKSNPYISKIVKSDNRSKTEKENRKTENAEKRRQYLKDYFTSYERPKKEKENLYEQLKVLHEQDTKELSYKNSNISAYVFRQWNPNAYHRDSKGNMRIDRNLKISCDVPKLINMNIQVPTQKCKKRCICSY